VTPSPRIRSPAPASLRCIVGACWARCWPAVHRRSAKSRSRPRASARPRTVKDKSGVDCLVAPRRYILDTLLAEAARRSGAGVRTGVTVAGVRRDASGRATGVYGYRRDGEPVEIGARFVVGADGLSSRVARSVGAEIIEDRGSAGATHYAYFDGLPWPAIEFHTTYGFFLRGLSDPSRRGLHLDMHPSARHESRAPRDGNGRGHVREPVTPGRAGARGTAASRTTDLTGTGDAPGAQPHPARPRTRVGTGR
jgi:hypothetical protein